MSKFYQPTLHDLFKIIRSIRYFLEYRSPKKHTFSTSQCIVVGAFFDLRYKGHEITTVRMISNITGIPQSSVYRCISKLIDLNIIEQDKERGRYKITMEYPPEILSFLKYDPSTHTIPESEIEVPLMVKELKTFISKEKSQMEESKNDSNI